MQGIGIRKALELIKKYRDGYAVIRLSSLKSAACVKVMKSRFYRSCPGNDDIKGIMMNHLVKAMRSPCMQAPFHIHENRMRTET